MAELRKLTDNGITEMRTFLSAVQENPDLTLPKNFLTGAPTSEGLSAKIEVSPQVFRNRMEAGRFLYDLFSIPEASGLERDPAIWAWLSCLFFDQLCPKRKDGTMRPGEEARWIPVGTAFRYYRHLLGGPYLLFKAFRDDPDRAKIVLCSGVDSPGDFVGQLASRQDFVQNKAVIGAATTLYVDSASGKPKRGASPTQKRPGTLRRFVDVVNQFDPVWDLYSIGTVELINKLPAEFAVYL
jgi:hypothetical protein